MANPGRHRYSGRRSPNLYDPARASLPITGLSQSSYGDEIYVQPTSRQEHHSSGAVPTTTTTIYAVCPVTRTASVRDGSRARRSSTLDSTAKRPIIVTTKHVPASQSSSARAGSPTRETYRSSDDGQYYTQPASSIHRSRSTTRAPFSPALDDTEYQRLKERTGDDRLLGTRSTDLYRGSPGTLYPKPESVQYSNDGYEYTKPSDLARYDLDHDKGHHRSRQHSIDRYYRPVINVLYDQSERRSRGPPPTTWGLDRIDQRAMPPTYYDGPAVRMPAAAASTALDVARRTEQLDTPAAGRRATSRTRPVSLVQDGPVRPSHHDEYYRSRDDDPPPPRDPRDRDQYPDDSTAARGTGLRVEHSQVGDRRRSSARSENRYRDERRDRRERAGATNYTTNKRDYEERDPRKRLDDDTEHMHGKETDDRDYRPSRDTRADDGESLAAERRRAIRKDEGLPSREKIDREGDSRKDKLREKLAAGLSLAAGAIGIGNTSRDKEKNDLEDKEDRISSRRRKDDEGDRKRSSDDRWPSRRDAGYPKDSERTRKEPSSDADADVRPTKLSATAESKLPGERVESRADDRLIERAGDLSRDRSVSADESKAGPRRRAHGPPGFDPNDTTGLLALKAEIAASEETEKAKAKASQDPAIKESSSERRSPNRDEQYEADAATSTSSSRGKDESRGRELVPRTSDDKQVRLVSPPRDRDDRKPIKGILKQPTSQFPEEPNPVREGVAPHKDDKTKNNVPPGARWTKINRKKINPEALTMYKERFEVRDDFVIVLRVLSKEEIQVYAELTAMLRGRLRWLLAHSFLASFSWKDEDKTDHPTEKRRQDFERGQWNGDDERDHKARRRDSQYQQHREQDDDDDYDDAPPRQQEYHGRGQHRSHRSRELSDGDGPLPVGLD